MAGYTLDDRPDRVLKNKLGATTHQELERLEASRVLGRYAEIQVGDGPAGNFDAEHVKAIYQHLFQDVYEWAGHTRDEHVKLSDGSVATEPLMHKHGGDDFLIGPSIPAALDGLATKLRESDCLRGLSREEFATQAADVMADLNAIHPFREGNGRAQRVFIEELAKQAGHTLDFSVVSKERMIEASIAANDRDDPSAMRRLFNEISDPARVDALRGAIDALEDHRFNWNDRYLATMEAGHSVEVTMVGLARSGEHFMARTGSHILIGNAADLPQPVPERGEAFTHVPREQHRDQLVGEDRASAPGVFHVTREQREQQRQEVERSEHQQVEETPRTAADQKRDRTEQTGSKVEAASREASKEKTAKEIERERRAAAVGEMLAERKADRDRDGGQER